MNLLTFNPDSATEAAAREVQCALASVGLYKGTIDGNFGPVSRKALAEFRAAPRPLNKILVGDGSWPWWGVVSGNDILLTNVAATAFGGSSDKMDDGRTASGYNTKGHPGLIAVSLPIRDDALYDRKRGSFPLRGSPIPKMPFGLFASGKDNPSGAHVDVTFLGSGHTVKNVPAIDKGPAKWTGNALDCSIALARMENPRATANNFSARVNVRVIGAAQWLG